MSEFGRIITAMITPFNSDGRLDLAMAEKVATHLVETGTDTILLAGTTGESPTLTFEEEYDLFKTIVSAVSGRAKVMAGTGSNCTQTAINASIEAEKCGVDGLLQVVPYYNKPSQAGLEAHFTRIANETNLPILLYNIPGRTGINMSAETTARLAQHPRIFGIKEASGDLEQVKQIRHLSPDEFLIYSGDDANTLSFMKEGAYGVVSVGAHCAGLDIKAMITAFLAGDDQTAAAINQKLADLFEVLFITSNPSPVKAALTEMGFQVGGPRLPLVAVTKEEHAAILTVLTTLNLTQKFAGASSK